MQIILYLFLFINLCHAHSGKIESFRVIDGDTIEATINIGWDLSLKEKFRMKGYNSPEIFSGIERVRGHKSKDKLKKILSSSKESYIFADKKGKYGRWISTIFSDNENVNNMMIKFEEKNK